VTTGTDVPVTGSLLKGMKELAAEISDLEAELCLAAASGSSITQDNMSELREQLDTLYALQAVAESQFSEAQHHHGIHTGQVR
jgi:hypothetical protein